MKAIIPVAGHGTRLEPHTLVKQKCLLPVGGRPVLEHILNPLIKTGVDEVVLIIGHLGHQVIDFCARYPELKFTFIEQEKRLGLGHAVSMGLSKIDEPVLVILGDAIMELDYDRFIAQGTNVIGVEEVPDPTRFGIVELDGDRIIRFVEKPENHPTNLAITGIYFLQSQQELADSIEYLVQNDIKTRGEYQLTDGLQKMVENGSKFLHFKIDRLLDCGVPRTILETNRIILSELGASAVSEDAAIVNSVINNSHISDGCIVENATLDNVIMLDGGRVCNVQLENQIIGFEQTVKGPQTDN